MASLMDILIKPLFAHFLPYLCNTQQGLNIYEALYIIIFSSLILELHILGRNILKKVCLMDILINPFIAPFLPCFCNTKQELILFY